MNALEGQIRIDFRSDEPLYLQVARQVESLIAQGRLKAGDQLPTVRELAAELRMNFNTVSRAYRLLDESGLISTQRGRGTFVWESRQAGAVERLRAEALDALADRILEEAQRSGFGLEELTQALERAAARRTAAGGTAGAPSTDSEL